MKISAFFACAAMCLLPVAPVFSAVSADEADHLGKDLTPVGAERAGNKDGAIPAWSGKEPTPAGWSWGMVRADFSHFKDEKPLFAIDASNVDKYADRLTPSQIATIKTVKDYRMDVYPSHRNCGVPALTEQRTKQNALEAKLGSDGFSLEHAKTAGVPFPIPKNGAEAMWNAKLRPSGIGFTVERGSTILSPRPGTDEFVHYVWKASNYFPGGRTADKNVEDDGGVEFDQFYGYAAPAALLGQAQVNTNYLNKEAETYYYFPGQRRVRRLPAYTFDTPMIGFENQYTVDQMMMIWSTLDRYDYKLVGKKEIYIGNNGLKSFDFNASYTDAYAPAFWKPEFRRYELHRVWVVDATVKSGMRHLFPHRTYYIDEDSWNMAVIDQYDATGKIWKMEESQQMPVWEIGGTCSYGAYQQVDVTTGRYFVDYTVIGQGNDFHWYSDSDLPVFKHDYYTADTLRAISER